MQTYVNDRLSATDQVTEGLAESPRLLDRVRSRARRLGIARRTEEADVGWIRRFILAKDKRHPRQMGRPRCRLSSVDW
jgi:hypothetical protein